MQVAIFCLLLLSSYFVTGSLNELGSYHFSYNAFPVGPEGLPFSLFPEQDYRCQALLEALCGL